LKVSRGVQIGLTWRRNYLECYSYYCDKKSILKMDDKQVVCSTKNITDPGGETHLSAVIRRMIMQED
jgi:hypothetical protein